MKLRPRSSARALFSALATGQVIYGLGRRPQPPWATRTILSLAAAASVADGVAARGRRGALAPACGAAVGLASELAGVATGRPFGRYAYSDKLGPAVGGVPLLVPVAWAAMARPAWVAAGWVTPHPGARVPVAAAALAAWDVFLDPRMVAEGYWSWEQGGRYCGVPVSNFAGWLLTGCALFGLLAAADRDGVDARDDLALLMYVWTWVGESFSNAVLWRRPLPAAAGATAMGLVSVPALRGRLR